MSTLLQHQIDMERMVAESRCLTAERERNHTSELFGERNRPFIHMKPRLFIDGDQWCALYGENLQDGLAGFGASPSEAAHAFDVAFYAKLPSKAEGTKS